MKIPRKWRLFLLQLWLLFLPLFSFSSELDFLLDVDRLHFYASNLSATVAKRGRPDLAAAIRSITPQDIANRKIEESTLRDPKKFDAILEKIVREKNPRLEFRSDEMQWNYNFFKNKLAESFRVSRVEGKEQISLPERATEIASESISPLPASEVTLDVDQYVADRTTRGLFWYTSKNQLPIELHMGTSREFKDRLAEMGGKIVGEVHPKARNYNKIYILQYPNQPNPVYAITGISGKDRLEHWKQQIALVRWPGTDKQPLPVKVIGESEPKIYGTNTLIRQLEALPKADHVIIGQKGAIGAAFRIVGRAEALLRLVQKAGLESLTDLSPEEKRALKKLQASGNPFSVVGDSNSTWDKLYEKLESRLAPLGLEPALDAEAFTIKNDSHTFSDYLIQNKEGQTVRWRVFSNTWGDEITPIAEALKATGHKKISYIGTAGAMPEANLRVGDLLIPDVALDSKGKKLPLPKPFVAVKGESKGGSVAHVGSPFEETKEWLDEYRAKARAVELEVYYLAKVFNEESDQFQANLLISDVVGSEHETLASATSAERKAQLSDLLSALFEDSKASKPMDAARVRTESYAKLGKTKLLQLETEVLRLSDKRDPVFQYHLRQMALQEELSKSADIAALVATQKPFTGADVDGKMKAATEFLHSFLAKHPEWKNGSVSLQQEIYAGTWNPKSQKLKLFVQAPENLSASSRAAMEEFAKAHPESLKQIDLIFTTGPPVSNQLSIPLSEIEKDRYTLLKEYTQSALKNAGLSFEFGPTDKLNFRWLPLSESAIADSNRISASNTLWRSVASQTSKVSPVNKSCHELYQQIRWTPQMQGSTP